MPNMPRALQRLQPSLSFALLVTLLAVLWLAGGASRPDALGQAVVRLVSWAILIALILSGHRPSFRGAGPLLAALAAALSLPLIQLIPLPPDLWQALPGRAMFVEAAAATGNPQPWRPISLVPSATVNAAASLIVPFVVLVLILGLEEREKLWLPGLVLCLVVASTLVGLLQFSGAGFNNPLINDIAGQVSGAFANRNHFAVFTAFGCMLAPVWAFQDGREPQWRGPVTLGLVVLFALTILASGSRAGILLGVISLSLGLLIVRRGLLKAMRRYPRWVLPAVVGGFVTVLVAFVVASVIAGRAVSIERVVAIDTAQDMRVRALPTVLEMIRIYFPVGSGLGGFDPVFRIHEPMEILQPSYFNHAHNDLLEIVLDSGLPGALLLLSVIGWWGWASLAAWRVGASVRFALPKLGSAMLLLVFLASITDYPARTPTMMAMIVMAGMWLTNRLEQPSGSTLPKSGEPL